MILKIEMTCERLSVFPLVSIWGSSPEVYKVPEPAKLVRRIFLKISLLAENFDQNPRVENAEIFCP